MTFENMLSALLEAKLAPVRAELRRLADAIDRLRRALPPQLVTIPEAARLLDISTTTVRRRVKDGTIPAVRLGHSVRVNLASLNPLTEAEVEAAYSGLTRPNRP